MSHISSPRLEENYNSTGLSLKGSSLRGNLPSSRVSCVRKTAALVCMMRCMFNRIFEVGIDPLEFLILSNHAMVFSPASFSNGFCFSPAEAPIVFFFFFFLFSAERNKKKN